MLYPYDLQQREYTICTDSNRQYDQPDRSEYLYVDVEDADACQVHEYLIFLQLPSAFPDGGLCT